MSDTTDIDGFLSGTTEDINEEEDEEAMTASEVLQKLEEAWLNEKFAPDLLPVKSNLVECMLTQIDAMENNIAIAQKGDFRVNVHRMEIDRIRYVISSYLRTRLAKIENFTTHVLQEEEKYRDSDTPLISDAELEFARGFNSSVLSHLTNAALRHMPANVASLNSKETGVERLWGNPFAVKLEPQQQLLEKYRKLYRPSHNNVNETTENVLIEEETVDTGEEIMDLVQSDQHIMRYKPIAALVKTGAVSLI